MIDKLTPSHFAEFFGAVYGQPGSAEPPEPFPWQAQLLAEIARTGRWPGLLDLPTAAGKTAVLDIAVFLMALRDDVPRRVVFVIDRRVVVDQAAERARHLADRLANSSNQVVAAVAERLRKRAADIGSQAPPPLQWAELRGGILRDETWALRPDVPTILVSTVDQVGSRLLFRGYGISQGMRPIHAGLLGNDVLYLLDEVHLARPFAETLSAISDRYRFDGSTAFPDRWEVVELSATPGGSASDRRVFTLSERDRDPGIAPVLARRLSARKLVTKQLVRARGKDEASQGEAVARQAAEIARSIISSGKQPVVGVILNRVRTARRAYELLGDDPGFDRCLITGRMRPFDRDDVVRQIGVRISTGRERRADDRPLAVIATQSIEVGADFDFDALVTECASLDALKQRFGRVDRDGQLGARDTPSRSVILAASEQTKVGTSDAVYGSALAGTWAALPECEFDFTSELPEPRQDLLAPAASAPILLSSHLDRWVQTSPQPDADPDVSLWLHGPGERQLDANVVWRADLTEGLLRQEDPKDPQSVIALVSACWPGSGEAIPVPLTAVRAWLAGLGAAGEPDEDVADVEGALSEAKSDTSARIKPALRWRGDDSQVVTAAGDIRPGDTIVVPSSYGGILASNWAPGSQEAVADLGHRVQAEQRSRATLRLHPAVLPHDIDRLPALPLPSALDSENDGDDGTVIEGWLASALEVLSQDDLTGFIVRALSRDKRRLVARVPVESVGGPHGPPSSTIFVVSSRRSVRRQLVPGATGEDSVDSEPETSSFLGSYAPVPLLDHLYGVEKWARGLASACRLPQPLIDDVALAGRLHDLGKSDPRFQAMLRQGRIVGDGLLAKSGMAASDRAGRERARRNAGYPKGACHELVSVAMVQRAEFLATSAHDWDLVLYLIASHHGFCRPLAPVAYDPDPPNAVVELDGHRFEHSAATGLERIDSGVPDRFWRLVRRYGWFELAWLESLLRLADHRASAEEQAAAQDHREEVTT
jgi:CRISPR-associated endonuclease/helicase Cas3